MKKRNIIRVLYVFAITAFLSSLQVYAYEKGASSIVYVSRTGEKYHYVENCSGMKNPIQMTLLEAINRGRTPCKDCVHEYVEQVGGFTDVYSILTPHSEDINWLANTGVSQGWTEEDGSRTFRPFVNVARCDMAAFLYRLASKAGVSDAATWSPTESDWAFTDVNTGSSHVKEVLWLAHSGVSKGWVESNGTKTFRPHQNVARCDMAAFLNRMV